MKLRATEKGSQHFQSGSQIIIKVLSTNAVVIFRISQLRHPTDTSKKGIFPLRQVSTRKFFATGSNCEGECYQK